jgi:membrane protease YdiL (CAAX protease family)
MRQITLFLVSVFGVTWTLLLVLRAVELQGELWAVLAWILPTVWSPTIIALVLTRSMEGPGAVRKEIRMRLSYRRGSGRWLLLAGIAPPLATVIAVFTARAAGDPSPFIPPAAIPAMFVVQLVTGAVGEELGWRGFLLPRLGKRFGEITAAWVMATLWSLWHVAAFFVPGMPHQIMPPLSSLLFVALFGIFLAFVFNRAGESVLATILAHLSLNIASGFGGVQLSSIVFWRTLVAIFGALAVLIALASRTRPPHKAPVPAQAE